MKYQEINNDKSHCNSLNLCVIKKTKNQEVNLAASKGIYYERKMKETEKGSNSSFLFHY